MGSIIERSRQDGSKGFTAQIVIKKGGTIVHREAQTFDRKQAANAWVVKREAELKRPGGLEQFRNLCRDGIESSRFATSALPPKADVRRSRRHVR